MFSGIFYFGVSVSLSLTQGSPASCAPVALTKGGEAVPERRSQGALLSARIAQYGIDKARWERLVKRLQFGCVAGSLSRQRSGG